MTLSDAGLEQEIELIQKWLQYHTESDVEHRKLELRLIAFQQTAAQRNLSGRIRQYGKFGETILSTFLPGGEITFQLSSLTSGFTIGFLTGAELVIDPQVLIALQKEFSVPKNRLLFNLGVSAGVGIGALKDLCDNIIGLLELAWKTSPLHLFISGLINNINFLRDPKGYYKAQKDFILGLVEFIEHLSRDPALFLEQGNALGIIIGGQKARWLNEEFMKKEPFYKGLAVGEIVGYIALEIALLFVGPAELAKTALSLGRLAMGSQTAAAVLRVLERVPSLNCLLAARRLW